MTRTPAIEQVCDGNPFDQGGGVGNLDLDSALCVARRQLASTPTATRKNGQRSQNARRRQGAYDPHLAHTVPTLPPRERARYGDWPRIGQCVFRFPAGNGR